jgi:hypothetical protein
VARAARCQRAAWVPVAGAVGSRRQRSRASDGASGVRAHRSATDIWMARIADISWQRPTSTTWPLHGRRDVRRGERRVAPQHLGEPAAPPRRRPSSRAVFQVTGGSLTHYTRVRCIVGHFDAATQTTP